MPNEKETGAPLSMADRDGWIWYDGKLVEWRSATTHVLTHSLHYGLAVFEGVRAYKTAIGTAIYRLKEHTDRLFNSAHIYMMKIPFSRAERLMEAQRQVVRENGHEACYVRPIAFYGSEKMGVSPIGAKVHVAIAWPAGRVPRSGGAREGHPGQDLLLRAPPRQRHHGAPKMSVPIRTRCSRRWRQRSTATRAAPRRRRLRRGRRRRKHLCRERRQDLRTRADLGAHRHHARLGDRARAELGYAVISKRLTRDDIYIADECFFTGTAAEVTRSASSTAGPSARAEPGRSPRRSRRSSTWSPAGTRSAGTGSRRWASGAGGEARGAPADGDHGEAAAAALPLPGAPSGRATRACSSTSPRKASRAVLIADALCLQRCSSKGH